MRPSPHRLTVRTPGFQPGNRSSILRGGIRGNRDEIVAELALRDGTACFYCGATPEFIQVDHVTASSRGGSDSVENLVLACPPCNYEKYTHPGWLYLLLRDLGPVPRRLPIRSWAFLGEFTMTYSQGALA